MTVRLAAIVTSLALTCPLLLLSGPASASTRAKPYDFNGDGYPELVVGVPKLQVRSHPSAGGVVVVNGSHAGLTRKQRVITQSTRGVVGSSEEGDRFGTAFASADFNRDGYADLAVGQPGEKFGGVHTGAMTVLFGSRHGLRGKKSLQLIDPSTPPEGVPDFGSSLAAADFDGDGWIDLAVGHPAADRVTVFRGGRSGNSPSRSLVLHTVQKPRVFGIRFGSSLAVGDLDRDGISDLVVGSGGRGYDYEVGVGADGGVSVCYGSSKGLQRCVLLADNFTLAGLTSLAVGNVSGSKRPEIVVGLPFSNEDSDTAFDGSVQTFSLSGRGAKTTAKVSELTRGSTGIPASGEEDGFGEDVALGDLNHDGFADLVVSAPWLGAGRVIIVPGGRHGYRTQGVRALDQNTPGIPGKAEPFDFFGLSVALADYNKDRHLDLTVGAPGENDGSGAITTLRGRHSSFTTKGARTFGLKAAADSQPNPTNFGSVLGP